MNYIQLILHQNTHLLGSTDSPQTTPSTQTLKTTTSPTSTTDQYYYIDVTINNYGSESVDLVYNVTGEQKLETAESMTAVRINLTIAAQAPPSPISFRAFKQNTTEVVLMDGGLTEVGVQPSLVVQSRIINIGRDGGGPRVWHFVSTLINQGDAEVSATFDNGTGSTFIVMLKPMSQHVEYFKIESEQQPPNYMVSAVDVDDNHQVLVNGKSSFVVAGSDSPQPVTLVFG